MTYQLRRLEGSGPGSSPHSLTLLWRNVQEDGRKIYNGDPWADLWRKQTIPPITVCLDLAPALQNTIRQKSADQRRTRVNNWKETVRKGLQKGGQGRGGIYRAFQQQQSPTISFLRKGDGTFTANALELDRLFHDTWMPILRAYAHKPEPTWQAFSDRFGAHIEKHPLELDLLDGKRLKEALGKMRDAQAAGMEGWRVAELKRLPLSLLNRLAQVLNAVERTGVWPATLQRALVSLVPKGEGNSPEDVRPITVMSAVYCLWASARVGHVMLWQERWIAPGQHGARKGHGTEDVYWHLAVRVEEALLDGQPLYGCSLDYAKCFDMVPQKIMMKLAGDLGMSAEILRPLQTMYGSLRRRFKIANFVGKEFVATNGILQGCPLSVVLLNALVSIWARAVEVEVPEAEPAAYVDDTSILANRPVQVNKGLEVTREYAMLTGQVLHTGKCNGFSTFTARMRRLQLGEARLQQVYRSKVVGATVVFNPGEAAEQPNKRIEEARELTDTLRWAHLPWDIRASLLSTLALPRGLFACSASELQLTQLNRWRQDVLKALLGTRRGRHCAEILFTIVTPGHRTDPVQAYRYQCLTVLHRMVTERLHMGPLICRTWALSSKSHRGARPEGPIQRLQAIISDLGWKWPEPFVFTTAAGKALKMQSMHREEWEHEVRNELRSKEWRVAAARRPDMQGIEEGVERDLTTCLLNSGKLSPYQCALLRAILAGAVWTQERLHRARLAPSATCLFCGEGLDEDHEHMWWKCKAWSDIRTRCLGKRCLDTSSWPPCLKVCGVVPDSYNVANTKEVDPMPAVIDLTVCEPDPEQRAGPYGELWASGAVVVYTDGAAKHNQKRLLRYAGVGAFWGYDHPFNISRPLEGTEQTNNRAELAAVIATLQIELRQVEIRTDSKYVADGVAQHRFKWRAAGWQRNGRPMRNADLWTQLDSLIEEREPAAVKITKVKGHTTEEEVLQGMVLKIDKAGNDAADALAVAGAFRSERRKVSQALHESMIATMQVQRMMVTILEARAQARNANAQTERATETAATSSGRSEAEDSNSNTCSSSSGTSSSSDSTDTSRSRRSRRRRRGRAAPAAAE